MKQFIVIIFACLISISAISQSTDLSNYSYVVVPDRFEFLSTPDRYQLNSMAVFYLNKSGFNAFLSSKMPNVNRCDGLYADVEEFGGIFGTKLQVVLRDCNDNEVYRSEEGRSKYKEYDKSYQDALRKAFESIERLRVKQKDFVLLKDSSTVNGDDTMKSKSELVSEVSSQVSMVSGIMLPTSKFSNYSKDGKSFLLRKTSDGYSLYEENTSSEDGFQLMGKIVVMEKVVKYMDTSGKVFDAVFDAEGNLTIKDAAFSTVYQLID